MSGTLAGAGHRAWIAVFITMGLTSEVASQCSDVCQHGGICMGTICSCSTGWRGPSCGEAVCTSPCQNGGTCASPNECMCVPDWTGSICSLPVCSLSCENGGTCSTPNNCTCRPDWTGPTCTEPVCSPECAHEGICVAPNTCACNSSYWGGLRCNDSLCFCINGGTCRDPNTTCDCPRRWTGKHCEKRSGVNLGTALLSLSLALTSMTVVLLGISLLFHRMRKSKSQGEALVGLEIQENVAYHSSFPRGVKPPKKKKKKKKTKIQYKPMNSTDAIYETPIPSTSNLGSEKESVYENAGYNLYD